MCIIHCVRNSFVSLSKECPFKVDDGMATSQLVVGLSCLLSEAATHSSMSQFGIFPAFSLRQTLDVAPVMFGGVFFQF
jgi:hypothetical protein